jgi:short-subunit dehydrogenase
MWPFSSSISLPAKYHATNESWAIVAGASEGLGKAWSQSLASLGFNLILIARKKDVLNELCSGIESQFQGIKTLALDLDLGQLASNKDVQLRIQNAITDKDVCILVYNAAYAPIGEFASLDLDAVLSVVQVNVAGPLVFLKMILSGLLRRGSGSIILMSSFSGQYGTHNLATYAASKSFLTILAEGLHSELKGKGVDVIACIAGAIRTPGYATASGRKEAPGTVDAKVVVEETFSALTTRHASATVFPGALNRLFHFVFQTFMPRPLVIELIAANTKKLV